MSCLCFSRFLLSLSHFLYFFFIDWIFLFHFSENSGTSVNFSRSSTYSAATKLVTEWWHQTSCFDYQYFSFVYRCSTIFRCVARIHYYWYSLWTLLWNISLSSLSFFLSFSLMPFSFCFFLGFQLFLLYITDSIWLVLFQINWLLWLWTLNNMYHEIIFLENWVVRTLIRFVFRFKLWKVNPIFWIRVFYIRCMIE
jgi:hypothetical protein